MPNYAEFEQFSKSLQGRLLRPDHSDYDGARAVWNGMIDRRPALIVQCAGPQDVTRAIRFARENQLPISVKAAHDPDNFFRLSQNIQPAGKS